MKELLLSAFLLMQGVSAGTVTGRLLGVDGTPAAGVRVTALSAPDANNPTSSVSVIVSITQTDASGRYRLENIPPGRYLITAGVVDFPTYYPGVAGAAGATAVTVTSGSEIAGMDFAIARITTLTVSGRVIRKGTQTPPNTATTVVLTGPTGPNPSAPTMLVGPDGSFQFLNVRPGNYSIVVRDGGSERQHFVVDNKDVVIELTVPLTTMVMGSVVVEGGGLVPLFTIMFEDGLTPVERLGIVSPDGTVTFNLRLPPGDYRLMPSALPAGYTYKSIAAGTTNLLAERLKVSATDSPQFVVTLGVSSPPPWIKVAGHLTNSHNQPIAGATRIALIRVGAVGAVLETAVGADGSFEFPMILPGTYTASVLAPVSLGSVDVTVGNRDIDDLKIVIP